MPMNESEIKNREIILAKEHLNFKHDYNEHCIEQVHIHNQVAEKFLTDEMNANFFRQTVMCKMTKKHHFLTQHTSTHICKPHKANAQTKACKRVCCKPSSDREEDS